MHTELIPISDSRLAAGVQNLLEDGKSQNTLRAYATGWRSWQTWADTHGVKALPASAADLCKWVADNAAQPRPIAPASLSLWLSAVAWQHRGAGMPDPTRDGRLRELLKGYRKNHTETPGAKEDLTRKDVLRMLKVIHDKRDAAMIALAFGACLRRSELVGLDVKDIHWTESELRVTVRWSETGKPLKKRLPLESALPVASLLHEWLRELHRSSGPLFPRRLRNGEFGVTPLSAGRWVVAFKRYARMAGIDPVGVGGHSLRRGFAHEALAAGVSVRALQLAGGWADPATAPHYATAFVAEGRAAAEAALGPRFER